MPIMTIALSRAEADLRNQLNECADSGSTLVVKLPGERRITIQSPEPAEDDDLVNELLESNPAFRDRVARAKATPRKSLAPRSRRRTG